MNILGGKDKQMEREVQGSEGQRLSASRLFLGHSNASSVLCGALGATSVFSLTRPGVCVGAALSS
jgi:hypothetical protein